ncbi:mediator of RNA polymerase II transcription subunit 30 [Chironomus tepperi]|uniref:mediator of RNA polymerase II transcription subunit 30 n=1 Tax=Chironomus tepperi TaxID=113505 RepID=UPI00391EEB70
MSKPVYEIDFQNQITGSNNATQSAQNLPQFTLQTPQTPGTNISINTQQKELNVLTLCRIGQETVQDILSRFQDIFSTLKNLQPPNGTQNSADDKKQKMQDQFRTIRLLFKRLRLLYEKSENSEEYIEIEGLIPYLRDTTNTIEPLSNAEEYQKSLTENRELNEVLREKNQQLKEIIDRIRNIISEINTMMSSRRC